MSDLTYTYSGIDQLNRITSQKEMDANILSSLGFGTNDLRKQGVYIFGTGVLGKKMRDFFHQSSIRVHAYVDNNKAVYGSKIDSVDVLPVSRLPEEAIVYIASITYNNEIQKQLKGLNFKNILPHFHANIMFKGFADFPTDMFFSELTEDLFTNRARYMEIFQTLGDDKSKWVFSNILNYRLTGEPDYLNKISDDISTEYFDKELLKVSPNEVFFDCGGFDGDSTEHFIHFFGNYKSVHIFEPDRGLLKKAQQRLCAYNNIRYNDFGVFSTSTTLKFKTTGKSDGVISQAGDVEVKVVALDDYETDDIPTYIKFDIEGAEPEAIQGVQKSIVSHQPKLAIASYHYPAHLWKIPQDILKINENYNLYLRHYSHSIFGSVYYFIPD